MTIAVIRPLTLAMVLVSSGLFAQEQPAKSPTPLQLPRNVILMVTPRIIIQPEEEEEAIIQVGKTTTLTLPELPLMNPNTIVSMYRPELPWEDVLLEVNRCRVWAELEEIPSDSPNHLIFLARDTAQPIKRTSVFMKDVDQNIVTKETLMTLVLANSLRMKWMANSIMGPPNSPSDGSLTLEAIPLTDDNSVLLRVKSEFQQQCRFYRCGAPEEWILKDGQLVLKQRRGNNGTSE